jgi:F0F1-type ATP synthase alpha subunit
LLKKGQLLTELLKQPANQPLPISHQIAILYAGIFGYLDNVDLNEINKREKDIINFISSFDIFTPYLEELPNIRDFDVKNNPFRYMLDLYRKSRKL